MLPPTVERLARLPHWRLAVAPGPGSSRTPYGKRLRFETESLLVNWYYLDNFYGGDEDCPASIHHRSNSIVATSCGSVTPKNKSISFSMDILVPATVRRCGCRMFRIAVTARMTSTKIRLPAPIPGLKTFKAVMPMGPISTARGRTRCWLDPETHEKGINNELYRLIGCIKSFRGGQGAARRPAYSDYMWDVLHDRMPGWRRYSMRRASQVRTATPP